jgi:hypothetical protein
MANRRRGRGRVVDEKLTSRECGTQEKAAEDELKYKHDIKDFQSPLKLQRKKKLMTRMCGYRCHDSSLHQRSSGRHCCVICVLTQHVRRRCYLQVTFSRQSSKCRHRSDHFEISVEKYDNIYS